MKKILVVLGCFFALTATAQKVQFRSGDIFVTANADNFRAQFSNVPSFNGKHYAVIQFAKSTSLADRKNITQLTGIQFFDYIPRYAFIASLPSGVNSLSQYGVKGVMPYLPEFKMAKVLNEKPLPEWINLGNGKIKIDVTFHNDIYKSMVEYQLAMLGMEILDWKEFNLAEVILQESQLQALSEKVYVKYMQPTSAPGVVENDEGRSSHRTNTLDADYLAGNHFIGNGITVSMGDDGVVGPHIDFQGRLTNLTTNNGGTHGDHVLGIVGGAGNFNPAARGNAAGADLVVYSGYGNISNATNDYTTRGVRITTNSLGQGCNSGYNNDASTQDQRINSNYSLMSVHSAGNSGTSNCGYVNGYYQITGGYKAGKNCLATGNLVKDDDLANSSSRGPAEDGRIKPDICAVGTNVNSTQPNDTYDIFTGTSMAAPGLAGTLASLWEAYKVKNVADPYSAVMKGIVLNSADDLGRPGPDFQYGWGRLNARRALEIINNDFFKLDTIDNSMVDLHTITVPADVAVLKIMVYYHDAIGAPNATIPLVNDINISATAPNSFDYLPWVLNYSQSLAALTTNAVRGRDSVNNVEQITVKNPQPGNWNVNVFGYDIPAGPQPYVLVYYFEPRGITLTYPQGGEHFNAGQTERVRWDANDINSPITLEYSADNGVNWNLISNTIPSDDRWFDWSPPATLATGEMYMRISRGTETDTTDAAFTVYNQVQNVMVDTACPNQFHLTWDAVPDATSYTIYQLGAKYMDSIGTSNTVGYTLTNGVNLTGTFYYAVRAIIAGNGAQGRISTAYKKVPGEINCGDDLINLRTSIPYKQLYVCAPLNNIPVTMTVKNQSLTGSIISNIPVFFAVNGTTVASETIAGPIQVGDSVVYTFSTLANLPGIGNYQIRSRCSYQFDGFDQNDTTSTFISVVNVAQVPAPLVQNFEGAFVPTNWNRVNTDSLIPWQKTFTFSGATTGNTHAAYMDFYNYPNKGAIDVLETPVVDLTAVTADSVIMTFDVSYANRGTKNDGLRLMMSDDCGQTWQATPYSKSGATLASTVSSNTIFSPTIQGEWRTETVDLTGYKGEKLLFHFEGINDNGNNLYLDNINIMLKGDPVGFSEKTTQQFVIYPNPSDGKYVLRSKMDQSGDLFYSIKDLNGKTILKNRLSLHAGTTHSAIDITYLPSGIYVLQLFDGEKTQNIRLTKN